MFKVCYIAQSGKLMFRMGEGTMFFAATERGVDMLCNAILSSVCDYMEYLIIQHSMQMERLSEFRQACRRISACSSGKLEMLERQLSTFSFAVSPSTYRIEIQAKKEINNLLFFAKREIERVKKSNKKMQDQQLSLNFSES